VRQSTDWISVDDPVVATAARFIRENISRGIKVEDVALASHVSRRKLEQRFVRTLSRTPHEEIVRTQWRLVIYLPQHTELKLVAIARRCGFKHPEYMTAAFTKRYGCSPSEWRRGNRK
jgi:LacI family transcriptional regulator